ncbi:MAG: amylo-alpha-1,6-glucosidase [bacterium]|jgi:predicted glycogen debranching enzyme|nr:MAG: glycogen debranching protein [bacterium]
MSLPPPLVIPAARLHDLADGASLEWLEVDGRGGFASGTAVGANTRRYHGVLVVARRPPADRVVLLSRLEEVVITAAGERYELATNYYPGVVHPTGHRWLASFRLDPWPVWQYRLGSLTLTKSLFAARDAGAVVVTYCVSGGEALLELRPLVAGRGYHALVQANEHVAQAAEVEPGRITYRPYPLIPPLVLSHDGGEWHPDPRWYYRTLYPRETERGLDDAEDLFQPGVLRVRLVPDRPWRLVCATRPMDPAPADEWAGAERRRRAAAAERGRDLGGDDAALATLGARLALAAEAFLVERDDARTIIAGYPWFADWGRDAMISIPGLCLALGRIEEAEAVLRTFAAHQRDGLIPNRFPDDGGEIPVDHYNAADASLWFVEAVAALHEAGGDTRAFRQAVHTTMHAYRTGTRFGIRLEPDGLVRQGVEGVQLTWMDAKVDGWVVTPRTGRAVEINALWYNALRRAAGLSRVWGDDPREYEELARRARSGFRVFWNPEARCLFDVIGDDGRPDPSLRPNQLFAVSLPHSPLTPEQMRGVVEAVERDLLVPLGVRTLAPSAPGYVGIYRGPQRERDAAYHSGTAWPWLLGPFATAYLRVHGLRPSTRERVRALLEPVIAHIGEYGLGHIAEVVGGDPPHAPGGCFAQAWSCAEVLRILAMIRRRPVAPDRRPR